MLLMDTIFFFFNYTATTEIYTLSLHDALPISADFYRPAHQIIYDTVLDLYGKGEPADPLTVAAELTRQGQIARVGGAPYLHTLMSSVPTAANAGYYAKIRSEERRVGQECRSRWSPYH